MATMVGVSTGIDGATGRIPLTLKLAYTAFVALLVPIYWVNYGPANFLYFCDVALLLTLVGMWRESPLLISMPAVGILAPQAVWLADFFANLAGIHFVGMTDYMMDASKSLFLRSLSLFHGWLPLLLVYLVWRVGYDERAFRRWTLLAWGLLVVCYLFLPGPMPNPGNAAVNINYVHGMSDYEPQKWMHPLAWLALLMLTLPVVLLAPVHVLLSRWRGLGRGV